MRTISVLAAFIAALLLLVAAPKADANIIWGSTSGGTAVLSATMTKSQAAASLAPNTQGYFALAAEGKFYYMAKNSAGDTHVYTCDVPALTAAALSTTDTVVCGDSSSSYNIIWGSTGYNALSFPHTVMMNPDI